MTRVTIEPSMLPPLHGLREPLELCDPSGRVLGYFTPATDRKLYEAVQLPISEEELDRRDQQTGGRTLAEILRDLEKNR
jgi:hypothetical protein